MNSAHPFPGESREVISVISESCRREQQSDKEQEEHWSEVSTAHNVFWGFERGNDVEDTVASTRLL